MAEESEKVSSSTSQKSFDHKQPENKDFKTQAQGSSGFRSYPHGLNPVQYEEHMMNRGAGIYALWAK
ncbi:unnamed protein product [Arabis nemorensis]|uniref:Uncharacterized protein n=1 Tax=Arabis nemorensis TaxID=586526 RepID=A0A565BFG2_9BRAS|nr:unnamed protein product [Arabis nemorensis]